MSKQWVERYPSENMEIEMSNHEELEYRVDSLLLKLVKILDKDEFSLLCYLAGKPSSDYQTMPTKENIAIFRNDVELGSWNDKETA